MKTEVLKINSISDSEAELSRAAELIRSGQLVAFPTETVYGLGANAMDEKAVEKIFVAKGRPGDNPLIVHIAEINDIKPLVTSIDEKAYSLINKFWPGPLTIIFNKSSKVSDKVTAGLSTVAIRMPSHPVALELIKKSGVPIAAPSANRSGKPSPTTAKHVYEDMDGRIPMILDGGSADVGVESTVLDMTGKVPVILRPGGVTYEMLSEVLGHVEIDSGVLAPIDKDQQVKSPGMKYKHYAPDAPVTIYQGDVEELVSNIARAALENILQGKKVGILATDETREFYTLDKIISCLESSKDTSEGAIKRDIGDDLLKVISLGSRNNLSDIAASLFSTLRTFDQLEVDIIFAEGVDRKDQGLAIMNRMARAAGFHIVYV